jgi:hypothetical protein
VEDIPVFLFHVGIEQPNNVQKRGSTMVAITHPIEGSPNWDSFERLRGADFIR